MKFTFEVQRIVFSGNTDEHNVNEVINALTVLEDLTITLPTASPAPAPAAPPSAAEADVPQLLNGVFTTVEEEEEEETGLTPVEEVYGAGFVYDNESGNPSKGFRQPVVGDIYLDPNPGDGSGVAKPRRKNTPTEYGPRLILTYR